jgi:hypothetical protein
MLRDNDKNFFHPNRYIRSRRFAKELLSKYKEKVMRDESVGKLLLPEFWSIVQNDLDRLDEKTRQEKLGEVENTTIHPERTMSEQGNFILYSKFLNRGKNIFYLSPVLTELLKNTDAKEITFDNLHFPYKTFYLAFGPQLDWKIKDNVFIDGAYISVDEGDYIQIALTTFDTTTNFADLKSYHYLTEETFNTGIDLEKKHATISIAIEALYQDEIESFKQSDANFRKLLERPDIDPEMRAGIEWVTELNKESFEQDSNLKHKKKLNYITLLREVSGLLFNAIAYLTLTDKDVEERFIESTPLSLLDQVRKAKTEKKKKELSTAIELAGYTRIKYCGFRAFQNSGQNQTGLEVSPHWRRGHFRNQPFGENLNQRKLIWIHPTIVRKDKGTPQSGHIYEAS